MALTPKTWLQIPGLLACGLIGLTGAWSGSGAEASGAEAGDVDGPAAEAPDAAPAIGSESLDDPTGGSTLADDPRVRAFMRAYGTLIDSVTWADDDVVFAIGGRAIHFQDGHMLSEAGLDRRDRCDSIFYRYPLEMPSEPAPPSNTPVRWCTDLQEALWGRTEGQIRTHARSTTFFGRRMFVNGVVAGALGEVERELRATADWDLGVAAWIDGLDVTYSFINRGIAGTRTRSQHAWGLAVDFVPASYDGGQVYWRWTRAWNPRGWHRTPFDERWTPPEAVVEAFERHGFLWGGKWARFDNIHFEYRPEILEYNRLLEAEGA